MVLTVMAESLMVCGIFLRSEERTVTMAASMAMSLPCPMAMLRSAWARAALSLIPSPAIATLWPPPWRERMNPILSSGRTPER